MSEPSSAKSARIDRDVKEKRESKKMKVKVCVVLGVLAVMVLFVALFGSNLFYTHTTAVDINGTGYTVADFNYYYVNVYDSYYSSVTNSYGDYASMFLPQSGVSLRKQNYGTDTTWAEYFEQMAIDRMISVTMLCDEAKAAGYTLTDDDLAQVESAVSNVELMATYNGYANVNAYLNNLYGKGMNEKIYRENVEREVLAVSYSQHVSDSFTYTDEQLKSYYAENVDDKDIFLYRSYFIAANVTEDDPETEEDETVDYDTAMAAAADEAKAFANAVTSEQDFIDYAASLNSETEGYDADSATYHVTQGGNITADYKEQLLEMSGKAGQHVSFVATAEDSSNPGYYVLYFISRDNNQYQAVSGFYGVVAPNSELNAEDYNSDTAYQAAVELDAREAAEHVLSAYEEGEDKTIDGFSSAMASESGELADYGGFTSYGIYDVPESIKDWLFDSSRKQGDTTIIYDEESGCFILYFDSFDGVYADILAENEMRAAAYEEWETERLSAYSADKEWEMFFTKKMSALGG